MMNRKHGNVLAQYAEETEERLSKYRDSILFASEVHNYKDPRYGVDKLARELLRLIPFGHRDFSLLRRATERNMKRKVHDGMYKRRIKPHKNRILGTALQREFMKLKRKRRADKRDKINETKRLIKQNDIERAGIYFEIELIKTICASKTPKTDHIYKQNVEARAQLIQDYEERGEQALVDEIRSKPPVREPIYKEVAQSIKKKYLQKHNALAKRKLEKELSDRIKDFREFIYPTPKDMYPVE